MNTLCLHSTDCHPMNYTAGPYLYVSASTNSTQTPPVAPKPSQLLWLNVSILVPGSSMVHTHSEYTTISKQINTHDGRPGDTVTGTRFHNAVGHEFYPTICTATCPTGPNTRLH